MHLGSEIALQIDFAAAGIAVIALLFSLWVSWRQSRLEIENLRIQRDNDIIGWSNRSIEALCSAEMLLRKEYRDNSDGPDYARERLGIMRDLSACVDQGRLYFPNVDRDVYGLHKEKAYQGHRHTVLDCLVFAFDVLRKEAECVTTEEFDERREKVTRFKRTFVSEVQSEVDPIRRVSFLTGRSR